MALTIANPFSSFPDVDGKPLENGSIWIGAENQDPQANPVSVFWDEGLTIGASQPLRTKGGFIVNAGVPANAYTAGPFSIRVQNKNGTSVYSAASSYGDGGGSDAASIDFTQAGSGAKTQPVQTKLRQYLAANDYTGVDPTGVTDSTLGLRAVFAYCVPRHLPIILEGNYRITGWLMNYVTMMTGSLFIECRGDCRITVDAASAAFSDVLYVHTTAGVCNVSITGGLLTIDGNNRVGRGISVRYDTASTDADCVLETPLTLLNFRELDVAATRENQALAIVGKYRRIRIVRPWIKGVNRANPSVAPGAAGATKGIGVAGFTGICDIVSPYVEDVYTVDKLAPGSMADADGIGVFGDGAEPNAHAGKLTITDATMVNCQGRSFKLRVGSSSIIRPSFVRNAGGRSSIYAHDVDAQSSVDDLVLEPSFDYRTDGVVNPLNSNFIPISFQFTVHNRKASSACRGGKLYSQVTMPSFGLVFQRNDAGGPVVIGQCAAAAGVFEGLELTSDTPLAAGATLFTRCYVEYDLVLTSQRTTELAISVRKNRMPISARPCLGYTGSATAGTFLAANQLVMLVEDNTSTIAASPGVVIGPVSGFHFSTFKFATVRNNTRFTVDQTFYQFNWNQFGIGTIFTIALNYSAGSRPPLSITNPPLWGGTTDASGLAGVAHVEILDNPAVGLTNTVVRVTMRDGFRLIDRHYTVDSGANWTTGGIPVRSNDQIGNVNDPINRNKLPGSAVINSLTGNLWTTQASSASGSWQGSTTAASNIFPA